MKLLPARRRTRSRSRWADDRGSSPVELAIAGPAVLILLFASIQVATWFLARHDALTAAQEAVTAQRGYNAPDGVGAARANSFLDQVHWLRNPHVEVTHNGDDVQATVTGSGVPFLFSWSVSQTVHGSVEQFTTDAP